MLQEKVAESNVTCILWTFQLYVSYYWR